MHRLVLRAGVTLKMVHLLRYSEVPNTISETLVRSFQLKFLCIPCRSVFLKLGALRPNQRGCGECKNSFKKSFYHKIKIVKEECKYKANFVKLLSTCEAWVNKTWWDELIKVSLIFLNFTSFCLVLIGNDINCYTLSLFLFSLSLSQFLKLFQNLTFLSFFFLII